MKWTNVKQKISGFNMFANCIAVVEKTNLHMYLPTSQVDIYMYMFPQLVYHIYHTSDYMAL